MYPVDRRISHRVDAASTDSVHSSSVHSQIGRQNSLNANDTAAALIGASAIVGAGLVKSETKSSVERAPSKSLEAVNEETPAESCDNSSQNDEQTKSDALTKKSSMKSFKSSIRKFVSFAIPSTTAEPVEASKSANKSESSSGLSESSKDLKGLPSVPSAAEQALPSIAAATAAGSKANSWKREMRETMDPVSPQGSTIGPFSHVSDEDSLEDLAEEAPPAPTSHVVIASYAPKQADEMFLFNGDLIGIEKEYSDGWARGQNISRGRKRCFFPLVILKPITSGPSQAVRKNGALFKTVDNDGVVQSGFEIPPRVESNRTLLQRSKSNGSIGSISASSLNSNN